MWFSANTSPGVCSLTDTLTLTTYLLPCINTFSLTGALPQSFGKLANLIELRLGSNLFSGPLKSFDDFVNLIQLDLSGKNFLYHLVFDSVLAVSLLCRHSALD